MYMYICTCIYA